jgi:hypothetical protein
VNIKNPKGGKMKSSILALVVLLSGVFAQAAEDSRLIFRCDQKHGHHYANIYYTGEKFFICFFRAMAEEPMTEETIATCRHQVWSEGWDRKEDSIRIDFHRGWLFEGDEKGGVLWNRRTTFLCERPVESTNP